MSFELDALFVEEGSRASALAERVIAGLPRSVEVRYIADGRAAARPLAGAADPFGAGKRRMVLMRRRGPFLMGCPAGSGEFACCGYLVLVLASNCPMDCSYCFLQEYVADNPGMQIFTNYGDAFDELDRLGRRAPERNFRIGTGELADSLAFDSLTGISRDLVEYFAGRDNLILELKTKTDEIGNLLTIDPKGRTLVSWTLSPERVFRSSEHRTAAPSARIDAARRLLEGGYKVAFHLDPIIAYPEAEADYAELIESLFAVVAPERIAFVSMGGLRMTPKLRASARRRFPFDPMLLGEEVLAADGRYRAFNPLRLRLYSRLRERIARANPHLPIYLCMESPNAHQRVFDAAPPSPAQLSARLAGN
ncbi:MAG: radical SAM protein [Candidatus Binataceae bacterium]